LQESGVYWISLPSRISASKKRPTRRGHRALFISTRSSNYGQTVLLAEDVPAYEKLAQAMLDLHRPATYHEEALVQSLIYTEWRLRRIASLEASIYAVGLREFADRFMADRDTIDAQIFLKYERQLKI
jgi:hypothetical protein